VSASPPNADTWTEELRLQYADSLATMGKVLDCCPAEVWTKRFGPVAFWHEAYHNLFWVNNFVGGADAKFSSQPFGVDIDPRLFVETPAAVLSQADAKCFFDDAVGHVERTFAGMTDEELAGPDAYDETDFRNVRHRLLYELRHLQHHSGKLIGYLRAEGVDEWFW
jgi:hypothetical protein